MASKPKKKPSKTSTKGKTDTSNAWDDAKEEQHRIRRKLILDAAAECLNERGYEGTSLTRIAKKLNMTNGALYYYFSGKMELAFECLMATHLNTRNCLVIGEETGENGLDMVEKFIVALVLANQKNKPWVLAGPAYFLTPEYAMRAQEAANENVIYLAKLIKTGMDDGTIRACDPNATAMLIFGSLILLNSSAPLTIPASDDELAETAKRYVSQSLSAGI